MLIILFYSAFPITVLYCPSQLIFGGTVIIKVTEAFYCFVLVTFNSLRLLSVILMAIMIVDNIIWCITKMFFPDEASNLRLQKCLRHFRTIEIIFRITHIAFGPFPIVLILVGILIISCTGSMTIRFYGKLDPITYGLMRNVTIIGLTYAILLTHLDSIPYDRSKSFFLNFGGYI